MQTSSRPTQKKRIFEKVKCTSDPNDWNYQSNQTHAFPLQLCISNSIFQVINGPLSKVQIARSHPQPFQSSQFPPPVSPFDRSITLHGWWNITNEFYLPRSRCCNAIHADVELFGGTKKDTESYEIDCQVETLSESKSQTGYLTIQREYIASEIFSSTKLEIEIETWEKEFLSRKIPSNVGINSAHDPLDSHVCANTDKQAEIGWQMIVDRSSTTIIRRKRTERSGRTQSSPAWAKAETRRRGEEERNSIAI